MKKLWVIFLFLFSLLIGCSENQATPPEEVSTAPEEVMVEEIEVDEERALVLIKKWHRELTVVPDKHGYMSDLLRVSLEDDTIETIYQEDFVDLTYGSEAYLDHLAEWVEEHIAHTQKQEAYKALRGQEPWLETWKTLLPYEMEKMCADQGVYMGKCGSIAHMTVGILRRSGLAPEDYVLLRLRDHILGIFQYNDALYMIDNNRIYPITEEMLAEPPDIRGFYHEDEATARHFSIDASFLDRDERLSLTRWLVALNDIAESDIYKSNVTELDRNYLEHRIDVPHFDLYLQASIEEPNVRNLAKEFQSTAEILSWVKTNIELVPSKGHVQLADETIVFGEATTLDRAVLVSSLLSFKDTASTIYHADDATYIQVDGMIYDLSTLESVEDIDLSAFSVYRLSK